MQNKTPGSNFKSGLNVTKTEIKSNDHSALQRLEQQYKTLKDQTTPLDEQHEKLHQELFKLNCFQLPTEQLKGMLLHEDWCEPITKMGAIQWRHKQGMDYEYFKKFPPTEIKAPVLNESDTTGFRYSTVFVTHENYIWLLKGLPAAIELTEKIREYNTLTWEIENLLDKRCKVQYKIKKVKDQVKQGKLTQFPGKKRRQVA